MAMTRQPAPRGRQKGGNALSVGILAVLGLIGLVLVSMPSVVVIIFGLLPTFVALLVDRTHQRFATFCVGAMNFAGVFPYLLDLWMGSNSMSRAIDIMTDVFTLFIMYGAAAFGWILFSVTPPIVVNVLSMLSQRRIDKLRETQKKLITEWGEKVAETEGETVKTKKKGAQGRAPGQPGAPKR